MLLVHRHTGGLEMNVNGLEPTQGVHRHTGGLEIYWGGGNGYP